MPTGATCIFECCCAYPCKRKYQLVWNLVNAINCCRDLRWMQTEPEMFCYQYSSQLQYGMYFGYDQNFGRDYMIFYKCSYSATKPVQLGWAKLTYQCCASQYLQFLKQHESALSATVKISECRSWRQVQNE